MAAVTTQDLRNQATVYINSILIAAPSGDGYKIQSKDDHSVAEL